VEFKKALVTGGAGFVGSHLSRALLQRGREVIIVDNLSTGKRENVPVGARFVRGDILDATLIEGLIPEIDIVFHEAACVSVRSSIRNFYQDAHNNIMGTLNLLRACAKSKVKKFVYASSMAVYADSPEAAPIKETYRTEPLSPYGIAKLASEKYCLTIARELGIACVILRYFNIFGRGQGFTPYVGVITIFIRRLLAGETPLIYGSGGQCRDFVHVGDVVDANLGAMEYSGPADIFNIGTGTGTSVKELALLVCSHINPSVVPAHTKEHPGELKNSIADISKARALLGYSPRGRLEEFMGEIIAWNRLTMNTP